MVIAYFQIKKDKQRNIGVALNGEALFDKNIHRYWKKILLVDESGKKIKNTVVGFKLKSEKVVYSFSDKQGAIYAPEEEDYIDYYKLDIEHKKSNIIRNVITFYSLFLAASPLFMFPLIDYEKKLNDPIRLARIEASEKYNIYVEKVNKKLDSVIQDIGYIYVYTNDKSQNKAKLMINKDVHLNSSVIDYVYFGGIADDLEFFLAKEDSLGYKVFINSNNNWLNTHNLNNLNDSLNFKILSDYNLSDSVLQKIKEYNGGSIIDIDTNRHRNDGIVISSNELKQRRLKNNFSRLLQPHIDLSDPTYKFYFSYHNKVISKKELESHLENFNQLFLKNQECKGCFFKKIKLVKHFSN